MISQAAQGMKLTKPMRRVLNRRSVKDKIAVPRDCRLCPVHLLPVVSELVRNGVLVWLDRATLPMAAVRGTEIMIGVDCDIYLLTPKGVQLCNQVGIQQT